MRNLETLLARVRIYIEDITAYSYLLYGYLQYPGWEYKLLLYRIVTLLARDKRPYHSHNRDFYLRLVAISSYSLHGKNYLKNTYRL